MNHWLVEELTWTTYAERLHDLDIYRKQNDLSLPQIPRTFTALVVLKLSDWLIETGEALRRRQEKNASISYWVNIKKFAR